MKPAINLREIKSNKVYGFNVNYWMKGGSVHDVVARFDDEMAFGHDPREEDFLWMMRQVLKPGDVFFDLGANIGLTTLAALRVIGKSGFVYAIEPDQRNIQLLSMTVAANNLQNRVHIHPLAISNYVGVAKFAQNAATNLSRIEPGGIDVNVLTLLNFNYYKGLPALFKFDIEGGEVEAIDGAIDLFNKYPDKTFRLLMEVHPSVYTPERSLEKQLIRLMDIGFVFKYVASAGYYQPPVFKELGYEPHLIFQDGNYSRGVYTGMDPEHALYYSTHTEKFFIPDVEEWTNKVCRSILLERIGAK